MPSNVSDACNHGLWIFYSVPKLRRSLMNHNVTLNDLGEHNK